MSPSTPATRRPAAGHAGHRLRARRAGAEATMLDAGRHYLRRMERSPGVPEPDIIHAAVQSPRTQRGLGVQAERKDHRRNSRAGPPVGGSDPAGIRRRDLSRLHGARRWARLRRWPGPSRRRWRPWWPIWLSLSRSSRPCASELEEVAVRCQVLKQRLLDAIDEDTWSFQRLMEANRVSGEGKAAAVREATLGAARVPLKSRKPARSWSSCAPRPRKLGMVASASDAGVGAAMARAAGSRRGHERADQPPGYGG